MAASSLTWSEPPSAVRSQEAGMWRDLCGLLTDLGGTPHFTPLAALHVGPPISICSIHTDSGSELNSRRTSSRQMLEVCSSGSCEEFC